jgi:hypothetical protein
VAAWHRVQQVGRGKESLVAAGLLLRWSLVGIRAICEKERGNGPADVFDGPADGGP